MERLLVTLECLNEEALGQLTSGNFTEAQTLLSTGLTIALNQLDSSSPSSFSLLSSLDTSSIQRGVVAQAEATRSSSPQPLFAGFPALVELDLDEVLAPDEPTPLPVSHFDMFRVLYDLPGCPPRHRHHHHHHDNLLGDLTPLDQVRTHAAIASFNLAVLCHDEGITYTDSRLLSQARLYYLKAWEYLKMLMGGSTKAATTTMELAICNNIGHIYAFTGDCDGILAAREALEVSLREQQRNHQVQTVNNDAAFTFFANSLARARAFVPSIAAAA